MDAIKAILSSLWIDPDRFPVALGAILVVTILGMFRGALGGNAQPFFWHIIDILYGRLGDKLNKAGRPKGDLIFRGFVFSVFVIITAFMIGSALKLLSLIYPYWYLMEGLALSLCLSSGTVMVALGQLYKALNKKKVTEGAYYTIARSTRTNLAQSDDYTITRVGMGMILKSFDKAMVAPIIWYLITGIIGVYIYAALAAIAWRFGKEGSNTGFGDTPLALERLMGFIPNACSAIIVSLATLLTPTASVGRAFKGLLSPSSSTPYSQGGGVITAAAWGLNVSLGGPTQDIDGGAIKRDWIGSPKATAQLEAKHLQRVSYLVLVSLVLWLFSVAGAMLLSSLQGSMGAELDFIPKIGASMLDFIDRIRLMFAQN